MHGARMDFYYFLKMTQVSSCGFESLLRHFFLSIDIYFYPFSVWVFIVLIVCFVSVNVTSVNILIDNITAFVWVWKIYEEKIDYWLLFIFYRA